MTDDASTQAWVKGCLTLLLSPVGIILRPVFGMFCGWLLEHTPGANQAVVDGLQLVHVSITAEQLPALSATIAFFSMLLR